MKATLNSVYLPLQSTKGVFIGGRGTKGAVRSHASNLGARLHKIAAETRQYLGGACSAACCALLRCPPVRCTYCFSDFGPWF